MHIGLIGGIGPAATEFYYRALIAHHSEAGTTLDLTIAHADVGTMGRNLAAGNKAAQAQIFAALVARLAAAGAKVAAVTSMGGHFCINELIALSPLPILNAIPAVAAEVKGRGIKKLGILGTATVMKSGLYGGLAPVEIVIPHGAALEEVHQNYLAIATTGRVNDAQRRVFFSHGERLWRDGGAEAILLGGTDLFLAFAGQDCPFPVLDSATIHAAAIYRQSV